MSKLEMTISKQCLLDHTKFWWSFISSSLVLFIYGCSSQDFFIQNGKIELHKMDLVIKPAIPLRFSTCGYRSLPEFRLQVKSFELIDKNKNIISAKMMGGETFILCNLIYPELAKRAGVEGIVELVFEVDIKGLPQNISITKAIGGSCEDNALYTIQHSRYYPAKLNNKTIRTKYKICIQFLSPLDIKNEIDCRPMEFSN